jgi:hypothetical protein
MEVNSGLCVPRDARVRARTGPRRGDGLFAGLVFPQPSRLGVKDRAATGTGEAASAPLQKAVQNPGLDSTNGAITGNGTISPSEMLLVADGS